MKKTLSSLLLLSLLSTPALADWKVNNAFSQVSFVSVKKNVIGEAHSFKQVSGVLNESGKFTLTIPLETVESNIPIRNERMRTHLFETSKFPELALSAKVDMNKINGLKVGESAIMELNADLGLHGVDQLISVNVMVTRTANDKLVVNSLKPVIISPKSFGMEDGVTKLQTLAKLTSITMSVPVSFVLTLEK
jgi:polyisoprenoid-binding protein YceI